MSSRFSASGPYCLAYSRRYLRMTPRTVHIQTFGCQMNKLDSELVLTALIENGYALTSSPADADVILFNTCSVRKHAEERVYSRLGSLKALKKKKPGMVLGVIGCMAEKDRAHVFERAPYVDLVCGVRNYSDLAGLLRAAELRKAQQKHGKARDFLLAAGGTRGDSTMSARGTSAVDEAKLAGNMPVRTGHHVGPLCSQRLVACRLSPKQAYVMAMSGCDCRCAYCVVPSLRGGEASRAPADIVTEVQQLADQGCVEVVLLGQNITAYGSSLGKPGALADLLEAVHKVEGIVRIRFVTSHPTYITDGILDAVGCLPKVCQHIHAPAQSGSDRVLARMGRGYTAADYLSVIEAARRRAPDMEFASDFIVGFPGETEKDFEKTIELMKKVRFLNSFVFKYSPRPGTKAAEWPDDVQTQLKEERNHRLLEVQREISVEKNAAMIGREMEVLVEEISDKPPHRLLGRTKWNHIVAVDSATGEETPRDGGKGQALVGSLTAVRITHATALALRGVLAKERAGYEARSFP